jgi:hypothetical protein
VIPDIVFVSWDDSWVVAVDVPHHCDPAWERAGDVAQPLDSYGMAGVPRGGGNGIKARGHSPTHTHRSALGDCRVYSTPGEGHAARLTLQKRGPHEKIVTDRRQGELTFDP